MALGQRHRRAGTSTDFWSAAWVQGLTFETATLSCLCASPTAPQAAGVLPVGSAALWGERILRPSHCWVCGRFPGLAPLDATSIPTVTTAETVPRGYHMSPGVEGQNFPGGGPQCCPGLAPRDLGSFMCTLGTDFPPSATVRVQKGQNHQKIVECMSQGFHL